VVESADGEDELKAALKIYIYIIVSYPLYQKSSNLAQGVSGARCQVKKIKKVGQETPSFVVF
jgi:hypothetical protein